MKERVACFLVPILIAGTLLYQVLASLQIAITHRATLLVIGTVFAIAALAGLLAAIGPPVLRIAVLVICALVFLDVMLRLSGVFEHLRPEGRRLVSRDETRIADIHAIQAALEKYIATVGPLPAPQAYREGGGPQTFWKDWWDLSSVDRNGDGRPFLEFLVDGGILPNVPLDPVNKSPDDDPRHGEQYVYFLVPPDYTYASGGACDTRPDRWHYMLAITDLEDESARPPAHTPGSGCPCLWREDKNYFQQHFDYVVCGSFDVTPEYLARIAEKHAQEAARKEAAVRKLYGPADARRVADLLAIRTGLEKYLATVGPLPAPAQYGEAEHSTTQLFWQSYWDVSGEDGDGDGRKFLDFLAESGTMPVVPVDPENVPAPDGDPRGGRQYVYMLIDPAYKGLGGSCGSKKNQWVYLLGITDLRSESTRPPKNIRGSGCECLWRDEPGYFDKQFDYVVCGTFTP